MIHINVIITAVVLLVAAFAALMLCMCVDIIPIIKSRGSTLASRDSVTRDQKRRLKESLQQHKNLLKKDVLNEKSDFVTLKAKSNSTSEHEDNEKLNLDSSMLEAAVTKHTVTTTTTTLVVETSTPAGVLDAGCVSSPEGDRSTQHGSSEASSSPHNDSTRQLQPMQENFYKDGNQATAVAVSVHREFVQRDADSSETNSSNTSALRLNDALPQSCGEVNRGSAGQDSPKSPPGRKRLPMVSQAKRVDPRTHQATNPSCKYVQRSLSADNVHPAQFQHTGSRSPDSPSVNRSLSQTPRCEARRCSSAQAQYAESSSAAKGSSKEAENEGRPGPQDDYKEPSWDAGRDKEAPLYAQDPINCKWCYMEHKRKHQAQLDEPHDVITLSPMPLSKNRSNVYAGSRKQWSRLKNPYPNDNQSARRCQRQHINQRLVISHPSIQTQAENNDTACLSSMRNSPIATAALHGSGIRSRGSPLSSSGSPSPSSLSSSSHSGHRCHRTRLEDIKEDMSCSEEESLTSDNRSCHENDSRSKPVDALTQNLSETHHTANTNTASPLHSFAAYSKENRIAEPSCRPANDNSACQENSTLLSKSEVASAIEEKHFVFDMKSAIEGTVIYSGT